jgi:transposase
VKLIWQARTKTDPIDAHKLAELARANVLPALWVPDPTTRARRQALRGRSFLVRQRTVFKNRVHAYLTAENLHCPMVDLYGKGGRAWLDTIELPRVVRCHVTLLLANIDQLSTQIRALDQELKRAPGPVGAHYQKLLRPKGKQKATVAAARKFCTYLYWMLTEELTYSEWLRQHDRPRVRPMQPLGSAA